MKIEPLVNMLKIKKFEALIYTLVVCLTLLIPSVAYFKFTDDIKSLSEEALRNGERYENLSRSIEEGRTEINKENVSATIHLQAHAEKTLASMYLNAKATFKSILQSIVGIALFQFFFVGLNFV